MGGCEEDSIRIHWPYKALGRGPSCGGCARLKAETVWVDGEGEGSIDLLFQEAKLWPFFAFNDRGKIGGRWEARPQDELRLG